MPVLDAITLRSIEDWRRLVQMVREHAGPMAARGTPLRVLVAKKMAPRRDVLNRLMWVDVLEPCAQQVCLGGQWFSAETFHEYLKRLHLPDVCAKGVEKWRYHQDGTRSLAMSTGDLDDAEFGVYLTAIQAHAATEWGVEPSEDKAA